jgi:hypothetical protein
LQAVDEKAGESNEPEKPEQVGGVLDGAVYFIQGLARGGATGADG